MNGKMFTRGAMLAAIALLAAAPGPATAGDPIADMLAGKSATKGKKLDKAIEKAEAHPLGSQENPVRVEMPQGQFAYLATLRCANGQPPQFNRIGNYGIGVFGNIIDGYDVRCEGSEPAKTTVFMDMYHAGHVETRPVPGFTIGAN
ncbi:hypothetical protein ATE67_08135 [Sphingopyxis sp. H050]|jgi:hypothetical protein|uniref:hypothetical protein n=1 Tax=Sphingopyxis sp. H050 TaxID=1759072 RepID=UPI00073B7648|nr:hypothetical protein [Sphingopyxis sp. H050]KTE21261.1 hypothetical protein ATE67_08135 [Sphingopyxis sp. H050]